MPPSWRAVAGTLLQGFFLTPFVGVQKSLPAISRLTILSGAFPLWRRREYPLLRPAFAVSLQDNR